MIGKKMLLTICIIIISGCASLGPVFQKVDKMPSNCGLIYVYRPWQFVGGGIDYDLIKIKQPFEADILWEDDAFVTTLYNGGYYPFH